MSTKSGLVLAATVLAAVLTGLPNAHAAIFEPLGDLPGGVFASSAAGISADGSVVTGYGFNASGPEAFRWTREGGLVGLGALPGGGLSIPSAISADGTTIVGYSDSASRDKAFRWTRTDGIVDLGDLPGGRVRSYALGTSANGSVVVGWSDGASGAQAFRWTNSGGMVALEGLPGNSVSGRSDFAFATSADGSVIVGRSDTTRREAFLWKMDDGAISLDPHGDSFESEAEAVSPDGSVVVGYRIGHSSPREAFRWTSAEGMVGLGALGSAFVQSDALATSADGSVVVGTGFTASGTEAFVWTKTGGMQTLRSYLAKFGIDTTGWTIFAANGVSADGNTFVASGLNPQGQSEGFIASVRPIPEPSTLALVVGGCGLLVGRRWFGNRVDSAAGYNPRGPSWVRSGAIASL